MAHRVSGNWVVRHARRVQQHRRIHLRRRPNVRPHLPCPSTTELTDITPRICWPFSADQPLNAMHITENLDIAYELLEVRTGPGLKPVHRTGKAPVGTLDAVRAEAAASCPGALALPSYADTAAAALHRLDISVPVPARRAVVLRCGAIPGAE